MISTPVRGGWTASAVGRLHGHLFLLACAARVRLTSSTISSRTARLVSPSSAHINLAAVDGIGRVVARRHLDADHVLAFALLWSMARSRGGVTLASMSCWIRRMTCCVSGTPTAGFLALLLAPTYTVPPLVLAKATTSAMIAYSRPPRRVALS